MSGTSALPTPSGPYLDGGLLPADFYAYEELLSDGEREKIESVREFLRTQVAPIVDDYWARAEFPFQLLEGFGGAAVDGWALGGGFELVLAYDLIVAAEDARFGFPGVMRGLVAAEDGLVRLPRRLPYHVAVRVLLTGERLTASESKEYGLVRELTPPGAALDGAREPAGARRTERLAGACGRQGGPARNAEPERGRRVQIAGRAHARVGHQRGRAGRRASVRGEVRARLARPLMPATSASSLPPQPVSDFQEQ
ncbi:enoyl-CoA hydratase-related protein [Streptomyces sp. NBC_01136]|uniref:enoyl-CoA hydratase-related protein n=1 Tax=unclassified Streptomyces TaxID=2593676 RepID=UPI003245FEE5|nr:enoyl-CoA hydratase-related protein [Streptomyces sp. NBC_01136]